MAVNVQQVMEEVRYLSAQDRALVAHCLISSLEIKHDDSVDVAWGELTEKRFLELESGAVKGVSWDEIRNKVTS